MSGGVVEQVSHRQLRAARGRGIDRVAKPLDDGIDGGGIADERRCQKDVIAASAVRRSAHRVNEELALHGLGLYPHMRAALGLERSLRRTIGHQLDTPEQATTADVTDKRMPIEARMQGGAE